MAPDSPQRPTTCIVIVTFNSAQYLPELFASLRLHTDLTSGRTQIVVVDNASSDMSRDLVADEARKGAGITAIHLSENLGFTGGNNRGIAEARQRGAEFVMCLNPDIVVGPRWLDRLLEVMAQRPEVAAAQPLILLHGTDRINTSGNRLHYCGFGYCGDYGLPVHDLRVEPAVRSVAYCSGAAMLLRMRALDEVGDFNEPLFLYHEDCELQVRMRQASWECVSVLDVAVAHKYKQDFSTHKYHWLERNRLWVLLETWPIEILIASLPVLLGCELAVLAFSIRGGWGRDKLSIYGEILRRLPEILNSRRDRMSARKPDASEVRLMTGKMQFEGLDSWIITRVANPILDAYFQRVIKRVRVHSES